MTRSAFLRAMAQLVDAGAPIAVMVVAGAAGTTTGIQLANEVSGSCGPA